MTWCPQGDFGWLPYSLIVRFSLPFHFHHLVKFLPLYCRVANWLCNIAVNKGLLVVVLPRATPTIMTFDQVIVYPKLIDQFSILLSMYFWSEILVWKSLKWYHWDENQCQVPYLFDYPPHMHHHHHHHHQTAAFNGQCGSQEDWYSIVLHAS